MLSCWYYYVNVNIEREKEERRVLIGAGRDNNYLWLSHIFLQWWYFTYFHNVDILTYFYTDDDDHNEDLGSGIWDPGAKISVFVF